jgi:hypothetical protein
MSQRDFDDAVFEMLNEFGGPATFNKFSGTTYNPATATSSQVYEAVPITLALFDLNRPNNGLGSKLGTEVQAGDKEAYVIPPTKNGGSPITPVDSTNDSITVGTVTYNIVTLKEVNPSGSDPLLYIFYLRR